MFFFLFLPFPLLSPVLHGRTDQGTLGNLVWLVRWKIIFFIFVLVFDFFSSPLSLLFYTVEHGKRSSGNVVGLVSIRKGFFLFVLGLFSTSFLFPLLYLLYYMVEQIFSKPSRAGVPSEDLFSFSLPFPGRGEEPDIAS